MHQVESNKFGNVLLTIDTKVSKETQDKAFKDLSKWDAKSLFVLGCEEPLSNLMLIHTSPTCGRIYGNQLALDLFPRAQDDNIFSSFVCLFLKDEKKKDTWMVTVQVKNRSYLAPPSGYGKPGETS